MNLELIDYWTIKWNYPTTRYRLWNKGKKFQVPTSAFNIHKLLHFVVHFCFIYIYIYIYILYSWNFSAIIQHFSSYSQQKTFYVYLPFAFMNLVSCSYVMGVFPPTWIIHIAPSLYSPHIQDSCMYFLILSPYMYNIHVCTFLYLDAFYR